MMHGFIAAFEDGRAGWCDLDQISNPCVYTRGGRLCPVHCVHGHPDPPVKKTMVVNIKNEKCDVYIGRGSMWGNPFHIGIDGTREEVIEKYRKYLLNNDYLMSHLYILKGQRLGCWCKPLACHGDILCELVEKIVPPILSQEDINCYCAKIKAETKARAEARAEKNNAELKLKQKQESGLYDA